MRSDPRPRPPAFPALVAIALAATGAAATLVSGSASGAFAQTTTPPLGTTPTTVAAATPPSAEKPVLIVGGLCPRSSIEFVLRGRSTRALTTRRGLAALPSYTPARDALMIRARVAPKAGCTARTAVVTFRWDPTTGWARPPGAPPAAR